MESSFEKRALAEAITHSALVAMTDSVAHLWNDKNHIAMVTSNGVFVVAQLLCVSGGPAFNSSRLQYSQTDKTLLFWYWQNSLKGKTYWIARTKRTWANTGWKRFSFFYSQLEQLNNFLSCATLFDVSALFFVRSLHFLSCLVIRIINPNP